MQQSDLAAVSDLAYRIHARYPERSEIFEEKLRLFPHGCFTLQNGASIIGYCLSHPWTRGLPPALDRLLGGLPQTPDTYFIHDLAIDERARGAGLTAGLLSMLTTVARRHRLSHLSLVAVHKSEGFWRKVGFIETADHDLQHAVRSKYSDEAIHMEMELDSSC
jgi:GNAT superfamily N-acetyltransferase